MKKKVVWVFSLSLYLLIICTMLSIWVEREMMPQVETKTMKYKGVQLSFSPDVLFQDEAGEHFYHAADSSGWESGLRAKAFDPGQFYYDINNQISFAGAPQTYRFIMSASRQPVEGEKVYIVEQFDEGQDQYVYYYPEGLPEDTWMPQYMQIKAHSQKALLVETTKGRLPFFQHKAKTYSIAASQAEQVFSLTEIKLFIQTLPSITMLAILIISGIIIWGMTCILSIQAIQNRKWVCSNIGLIIALFVVCPILLNHIDLPASLLPSTSLFDLNAYSETFILVFNLLEQCGETALFSLWERTMGNCMSILAIGTMAVLLIVFIEAWHSRKNCGDKLLYDNTSFSSLLY